MSDSFTFSKNGSICQVMTHSILSNHKLDDLMSYAYNHCSTLVVILQVLNGGYCYVVSEKDITREDINSFLQAVQAYEYGWYLDDVYIKSPCPSKLNSMQILDILRRIYYHES